MKPTDMTGRAWAALDSAVGRRVSAGRLGEQLGRLGHGRGVEVLLPGTGDDKHDKDRLHLDLRSAPPAWNGRSSGSLAWARPC
jgi:hypothetical protein